MIFILGEEKNHFIMALKSYKALKAQKSLQWNPMGNGIALG